MNTFTIRRRAVTPSPWRTGANNERAFSKMFFRFAITVVEETYRFLVPTTRCKLSSITRLMGFLILFPAIAAPRPPAEARHKGDVPRFLVVGDGLYRGGQPSAAGFQMLKEKGIKTIINLRAEDNSEAKLV